MVRCWLEGAFTNEDWHTLFSCSYTEYLGIVELDHRRVVAYLENKIPKRRRILVWQKMDRTWCFVGINWERLGWIVSGKLRGFCIKIINCHHEIAKWRKNNPPYGKVRISELQKALKKYKNDNNRIHEDIPEVCRKLQETYKDEENFWQQKSSNM